MCSAISCGRLDVLQLLLTERPDASSPHLVEPPMLCAARSGSVKAMQLLVEHGADINGRRGTPWSELDPRYRSTSHAAVEGSRMHALE
jgi:hypothetical protein